MERHHIKQMIFVALALLVSMQANFVSSLFVNATNTDLSYRATNNFYFKDFTADYYLWRDEAGTSRMLVVEELTAVFPSSNQNHGITRVIPFTNNDGKNLTMDTGDTIYIDVERNGIEEPVSKVEVGDGYYNVYIGDADEYVHGEQVYTLTYEFENLILDFDDWQELYWDANGNDWSQRFDQVTARVHLDEGIADQFTGETSCYVGRYGSTGQNRCQTSKFTEEIDLEDGRKSAGGIEFTASKLSAGETLTFDLEFQADTFAPAPKHFNYTYLVMAIIATIGAVGLIILMLLSFRATAAKRKYYKNLFVKPEYTPAPDLTVAEMASNYIGKGVRGDAKVATLLELAVNHKIELVKTEREGAFGKKKTQWLIRVKTDTMNKEQAIVLKILAGSDTPLRNGQEIVVKSHRATSELTGLVTRFKTTVDEALKKKGLAIATSKKVKGQQKPVNFVDLLGGAAAIWLIGWMIALVFLADEQPAYITMVGGTAALTFTIILIVVMFLASLMVVVKCANFASHTEKGLEYSRYLEGLKMYMEMAEADRLKMLQSVKGADTTHEGIVKVYEKLLPYAMIFKLEKSWLDELSRYYEFDDVAQPNWYFGVGAFSAAEFRSAMNSMNTSISNSIAHSTTSGSSSGFSGGGGGGFAGGGGGGGGGGGW